MHPVLRRVFAVVAGLLVAVAVVGGVGPWRAGRLVGLGLLIGVLLGAAGIANLSMIPHRLDVGGRGNRDSTGDAGRGATGQLRASAA